MRTFTLKGFVAILISLVAGCQRSPQPNPLEKIKTPQFRQFEQELSQKAQTFSNSAQLRFLAAGDSPSLSPNGKHIAFSGKSSQGGYHIWSIDVDGTNLRELSTFGWEHAPQWSPDSKTIIFQSYGPKNWLDPRNWWGDTRKFTIWAVDIEGENQRQLIPADRERDQYPLWSPDGKHIVWTRGKNLWVADSRGQNPRPLTTNPKEFMTALGWSLDGQTVFSDPVSTTHNQKKLKSTPQCTLKTLTAIDINGQNKHRLETKPFEPVLREKGGSFHYCVDKGNLFKVAPPKKTSQLFEIQGPMFFESATVSNEQKTLVFGLMIKGGSFNSILALTLKE